MNFDEKTIENTDRIQWGKVVRGRTRFLREGEKKVKWKTSPLVAHAARIAKPTLCVVAIGVGVVAANEGVSGFKKGIEFDAKEKERESRKIHKRSPEERKHFFLTK